MLRFPAFSRRRADVLLIHLTSAVWGKWSREQRCGKRYRCPCGYETDKVPSGADRETMAVYYLHRHAVTPGLAEPVTMACMEPVVVPAELRRSLEVVGAKI